MNQPRISLDQWSALVSVVESGGYARAGEAIHKSQSTLSYSIKKLESLLGVQVFRLQGRKNALTPAGEVLYRRGKTLLEEAAQLETAAGNLAQGQEPEIRLAVEILFPTWLLLACLAEFAREQPQTRIDLLESVLGGTDEALLERRVHFAIGSRVPPGFAGDPLLPARFVCAAAPGHPLHKLGRQLTLDDLRGHRHLVIRDSGVQRTRPGANWVSEARWTVSSKATSIRAAVMGLGFSWYHADSIREELDAGALKPLPLREGAERVVQLYLVFADREATGPGALRLAEIIRERTRVECEPHTGAPAGGATAG